ncbi:hypothetical protein M2308_002999 [Rhizobium leguminosarum]|nr:hypothetical protein [Rhizobium leguminosarum]
METINQAGSLSSPRKHKLKIISHLRMVAILAACSISCIATATEDHRLPAGTYCGQLLSGGVMTEAETTFVSSVTDSKITGSYVFFDKGQAVTGSLFEPNDDDDGNDLTRKLVWQDRYGHGNLVIIFTSDFSAFQGNWGDGGKASFPWNGKRCEPTIAKSNSRLLPPDRSVAASEPSPPAITRASCGAAHCFSNRTDEQGRRRHAPRSAPRE